MKLFKPVSGIEAEDLRGYPAHWIDDEWEKFASTHKRWLSAIERSSVLYCLPETAIDSLERTRHPKHPLLNTQAIKAERDLARLCLPVGAIGLTQGRFIYYPPLAAAWTGSSEWPPRAKESRVWRDVTADEAIVERLTGYVGRLITEPCFLEDVEPLSRRWHAWPEAQRPILPLARFICANDYPALVYTGTPQQKAFEEDFRAFCDRWLLAGMETWDLPVARGPVLPDRESKAEVFPTGMVSLVVPFFYPLLGDDSLLWAIYQRQKDEVRQKGLDPELAGLAHFKAYGHILTVAHVEQVIVSRYFCNEVKWGVVSQVEDALHGVLGFGKDQIKKLRKAISACRRGKRAGLKWLRPRKR